MATFVFTARDKSGKKITSQVEAADEKSASKSIRAQGLSPIEISQGEAKTSFKDVSLFNRIRTKDKIIFARQLSTLINAGLPLVQSLHNVENQVKSKPFLAVLSKVRTDIEGGSSFSDALARHPKVFNLVFVSLIAAGEASGTLDKTLERLANQQEKDAEILSKVRGALIYPLVVIVVMFGVVTFMLTAVLPQVEGLYKGIPGATLPLITRVLLSISHLLTNFWWLDVLLFIVGGFFVFKYSKTGPGKEMADKIKLRMWPISHLFMKVYMARFARTAETLVASGVPLLQMMDIVAQAVNNTHIARSLYNAAEKVKGGKALSESIAGDPNFLELVPNMIQIGEQSGSLESMLGKTADYYEKEVDTEIKNISTLIEPLLMIMLGIAALIIVAAVLLPIYNLAGKFST